MIDTHARSCAWFTVYHLELFAFEPHTAAVENEISLPEQQPPVLYGRVAWERVLWQLSDVHILQQSARSLACLQRRVVRRTTRPVSHAIVTQM